MRTPLQSQHDTVWKDVPALDAGYNLDGLRYNGFFSAVNPTSSGALPAGEYFVRNLAANVNGLSRVSQSASNTLTGVEYFRAKGTDGWTAWTTRGSGGGGGSGLAEDTEYSDAGNLFGTGSTTNVQAVLDEIAQVFSAIPTQESAEYDIRDFGGVGDGTTDNRAAFAAAVAEINAAGGGVLYVPKGVWGIGPTANASLGGVRLGSNTVLRGDGIGLTVIKALDLGNTDLTGIVRTYSGIENENVLIRDLTIDGNKSGQTGFANIINFYCGVTPDNRVLRDKNIYLVNVESKDARNGTTGSSNPGRGYGIDPHEMVDNFVMLNCVVHGCELDGVIHDGVYNFKNIGTSSYSNGRHGFNYVKESYNGLVLGNQSYDNGANGILIQQNSNNIRVIGNMVDNNAEQGIRVRRGDVITDTFCILGQNIIRDSGRSGINITGACYNEVSNNLISGSSKSADDTYFDVNMQADDGDADQPPTATMHNVIRGNSAYALSANISRAAYREDLSIVQNHANTYLWNIASGQTQGKYKDIAVNSVVSDLGIADTFNVREWGAVGDGVTDDSAVFRACVDFVEAKGGGMIYVPPGRYRVSGTGVASQGVISLPSNVGIIGAGKFSTVLVVTDPVDASITGVIRTRSGASNLNVVIRDIGIECESSSGIGGVTGIYVGGDYAVNTVIDNVAVNYAANGADSIGYGIRVVETSEYTYISDCTLVQCERDGIYLDGSAYTTIRSTGVDGCTRYGVNISNGARDTIITDPNITGAGAVNVVINSDAYNVQIDGGVLQESGEDNVRIRRGASVSDTYVSLSGITFKNSGRDAVSIAGACRNEIIGCIFKDSGINLHNTYNDVSLEADGTHGGAAENNSVLSCIMSATAGNKAAYGVREYVGAANNNTVAYSLLSGHTAGSVLLVGAASRHIDESALAALGGRNGGQQLYGGVNASENLTLSSTTSSTKGRVRVASDELTLFDQTNNTKLARFAASGISAGAERVLSIPDSSGTLALVENRGEVTEGYLVPNSGSTTLSSVGLLTSTSGTATARTPSNVNLNTSSRRLGYVSSSTAGNSAGIRQSSRMLWIGDSVGVGGFSAELAFSLATALVATQRGFCGLVASTTFVVDTDTPSAVSGVDLVGIGFDDGDTTLSLYYNDNVGVPTKVGLGASFPVAVDEIYRLKLSCDDGGAAISYTVRRVGTAVESTGSLTTDIPRDNIFMALQAATHNGATATQVELDIHGMYYTAGSLPISA